MAERYTGTHPANPYGTRLRKPRTEVATFDPLVTE
jgi:hypothetical protein